MTTKEILIEQLKACYNETNWFVTMETALDGLTEEQANWRAENLDNSIREEVNHLSRWNEHWLRRFRGESLEDALENDDTFMSETDWQTAKDKLFQALAGWQAALNEVDEDKLTETVSEDYDEPWSSPIANTAIHNAYHIGQIVFIRKLQGSWDRSQGVL
jgi:uncharacterized damage-inducible protein DinB